MYTDRLVLNADETSALIARCVQGDTAAKAQFYDAFSDLVRTAVARKLAAVSDAEDLTHIVDVDDACHEIFVDLFADDCSVLGQLRKPGSIRAWLMTVAQNHVASYARRKRVEARGMKTVARELPAGYGATPEDLAISAEQLARLRSGLDELTDEDRLTLNLYFVHGLKYAEMAELLGLNINTLSARLRRAKEKLRKLYGEDPHDPSS